MYLLHSCSVYFAILAMQCFCYNNFIIKEEAFMKESSAKLLLIFVFLSRAGAYLFSKLALLELTPFLTTGYRFTLSCLLLLVIFHKRLFQAVKADKSILPKSALLGTLLFFVMFFELTGLKTADIHTIALIESLNTILVPILLSIRYRKLPAMKIVLGGAFILLGEFCLTWKASGFAFTGGEIFGLFSALSYALYIIFTGTTSRSSDPFALGVLHMGVIGVLSLIVAGLQSGFPMPVQPATWVSLAFQILVCSCFGFTYQPVAQKYVPSEEASMFGIIVPLGASLLGHLAFGEVFGAKGILGTLYIIAGLLTVNKPVRKTASQKAEACQSKTADRTFIEAADDRCQMIEPVVRG